MISFAVFASIGAPFIMWMFTSVSSSLAALKSSHEWDAASTSLEPATA